MRTCSICKEEKSLDNFRKRNSRCIPCEAQYQKDYVAKNRERILEYKQRHTLNRYVRNCKIIWGHLKSNPCKCGVDNPIVLEFDHIGGEKSFTIGVSRQRSTPKILQEIAKCQILCCNCHKRKTAKEQNWYSWMGETATEDDLGTTKHSPQKRIHTRRLYDFLSANPCVDCGETDPLVLEFDHVRGEKFKEVGRMTQYSWDKIVTEVAKCEVRCGNCHKIKTAERANFHKYCA